MIRLGNGLWFLQKGGIVAIRNCHVKATPFTTGEFSFLGSTKGDRHQTWQFPVPVVPIITNASSRSEAIESCGTRGFPICRRSGDTLFLLRSSRFSTPECGCPSSCPNPVQRGPDGPIAGLKEPGIESHAIPEAQGAGHSIRRHESTCVPPSLSRRDYSH